jgi:hypothetical protein
MRAGEGGRFTREVRPVWSDLKADREGSAMPGQIYLSAAAAQLLYLVLAEFPSNVRSHRWRGITILLSGTDRPRFDPFAIPRRGGEPWPQKRS